MRWIDFAPLAEFVDRSGVTRSIYGCSLLGRFEFIDRQEQLKSLMDAATDDQTWQVLCLNNRSFATAVDRCLQLNGIDPDWVTPEMIEQFLFARFEDGVWKSGWLVEINTRSSASLTDQGKGEGIESTLPNLLALVSLSCDSLSEAIDLAGNMPGNLLLDTIEARGELMKSPEQRAEDVKAANMDALRRDYSGLYQDL